MHFPCGNHIRAGSVCNKLGKVGTRATSVLALSGVSRGFDKTDAYLAHRQAGEDTEGMSRRSRGSVSHSAAAVAIDRQNDSNSPGSPPSSIALPQPSIAQEQSLFQNSVLRDIAHHQSGGKGRAKMVDQRSDKMERQTGITDNPSHGDRDRRIPLGMGSILRRAVNWGYVDYRREKITHQSSRAAGRNICREGLSSQGQGGSCQAENGQSVSGCVYQPHGRYKIPGVIAFYEGVMVVVPPEGNNLDCRVFAWKPESGGGQRIQDSSYIRRVETGWQNVRDITGVLWGSEDRYVRYSLEQPNRKLHQLETGPLCHGRRRLPGVLERDSGRLCLSTFLPNWQVSAEVEGRAGNDTPAGSGVACSALVPYSPRVPDRPSLVTLPYLRLKVFSNNITLLNLW